MAQYLCEKQISSGPHWLNFVSVRTSQAHSGDPPIFQQITCPWPLLEVADCAAHHGRKVRCEVAMTVLSLQFHIMFCIAAYYSVYFKV